MLDEKNIRLDEINENLKLYQIKDGLLFGTDALKLADFICAEHMGRYNNAIELGAGSGVISLLLAYRGKINLIYAVEIQDIYAELALLNTTTNGLSDKIKIINGDLKTPDELYFDTDSEKTRVLPHSIDMVFTNPPYIKNNSGVLSDKDYKNIARRETLCTIDDVLCASARLLKNGGDFYCVYRTDRLQSLFSAMTKYNITPKKAVFIYGGRSNKASLVLIKGKQNANEGIVIENLRVGE